MSVDEIKNTCIRVDALVRERDSDEFMWEDALTELGVQPKMGIIVLALLFAKEELWSGNVCRQVQSFLQRY